MECLSVPSPVTATAFGASGKLGVASEDGILRIYETPYKKVWKAVRNLGSEISSLVFDVSSEPQTVWVACGQHILRFGLQSPGMIFGPNDATLDIRLTDEHDDVLNEITTNGSYLAYTLDSGIVGIVDLKTLEKSVMKTSHENLCTNVSFIPDRPSELVSGGYDSTLLHFDFHTGTLLSAFHIGSSELSAQVSLSPPFVLSLSVSTTGLLACGLADGRVWLGCGGERTASSKGSSNARKKKRRKWDGLRADDGKFYQVAEGPVVAVGFASPSRLVSLTLLGTVKVHQVEGSQICGSTRSIESAALTKANALTVTDAQIAVGGLDVENKGILLLWPL